MKVVSLKYFVIAGIILIIIGSLVLVNAFLVFYTLVININEDFSSNISLTDPASLEFETDVLQPSEYTLALSSKREISKFSFSVDIFNLNDGSIIKSLSSDGSSTSSIGNGNTYYYLMGSISIPNEGKVKIRIRSISFSVDIINFSDSSDLKIVLLKGDLTGTILPLFGSVIFGGLTILGGIGLIIGRILFPRKSTSYDQMPLRRKENKLINCLNCGALLDRTDQYCSSCGFKN